MSLGHDSSSWRRCLLLLLAAAGWLAAREVQAQPKTRVTMSPAVARTYLPGRWGTIELQFSNLDDQPAELFAASYFEQERTLQFGRKAWVPAMARLRLTHPIKIPALEKGNRSYDFRTMLLDPRQEDEVLLRSGGAGDLQYQGTLRVGEEPATAIINVAEEELRPGTVSPHWQAYELVVAAKSSELLGRRMAQLNDPILPATPEAYASIDQIVVADNRLTSDGPAIAAIRRWLFGGGHLWVLLDRVDPRLLELLLGDDFPCEVVDRVELTTVRIQPTDRTGGAQGSTRDYDQAISMVRALVDDVEVACTVEGWPAAFWKQCGEGKLLVTTLAPEGWMRKGLMEEMGPITRPGMNGGGMPQPGQAPNFSSRAPAAAPGVSAPGAASPPAESRPFVPPPPADPQEAALVDGARGRAYMAVPPLRDLAAEFFGPRNTPILQPSILEPHVQEYVGKSVPSRWLITTLLAGFSALLTGVGAVLWYARRLEWLGLGGPALAVGVGLVLMGVGFTQRRSVPATVAHVQFVEPVPGTSEMRISGVTNIFAPDAKGTIIASQGGGWILPDRSGQEGQTVRMVWSDMDAWEWKHLPPTSGQRLAVFSTSQLAAERIHAKATFGPNGLTGRLEVAATAHPADAVLATRDGRIGVNLNPDGSFAAPASQVFSAEQFVGAELLSDEQNRRSRTLAGLLAGSDKSVFPQRPTLLVWVDPLDVRFHFDEAHRQLGSALVAVPLTLERPPAGTEVEVSSPFLPYRSVSAPDGTVASSLYDYRRRAWQDRTVPSSAWLRFQVPGVLLPLEPLRAKLTVQVAGPVGKLEIAAIRGKEVVPLKTWLDPVGTLSLAITDPALLQGVDGGLLLQVAGGDPARPQLTKSGEKANYWHIESLRLDLHGKTAPVGQVPPPSGPEKERR